MFDKERETERSILIFSEKKSIYFAIMDLRILQTLFCSTYTTRIMLMSPWFN
jgi:hypothetical protein